jgi:hypothetical protein
MSKHLTITRLGLLTAVPQASPPLITSEFLIGAFRKQAEAIARTFPAPRPGVGSIEAKQIEIAEVTAERPTTPFDDPQDTRKFGMYVARLPHHERHEAIGKNPWIISESVSITSGNLEGHPSEVWLTLAGMPEVESKDEAGAPLFLDWMNARESVLLDSLKYAYEQSLAFVSTEASDSVEFDGALVKISVTDDDTRAVASLVDAMYFDGAQPSQMSNKEARQGLARLGEFVQHAGPNGSMDDPSVDSSIPGIKGIICNGHAFGYTSLVAGFARRAGDGGGYQRELDQLDETSPLTFDEVCARSPARHLSARLAHSEALKWSLRVKAFNL